jgi:hypothetical protein
MFSGIVTNLLMDGASSFICDSLDGIFSKKWVYGKYNSSVDALSQLSDHHTGRASIDTAWCDNHLERGLMDCYIGA